MTFQVQTDYKKFSGADQARKQILDWAKSMGSPVYIQTQSYKTSRFERYADQDLTLDEAFAGRIFGPNAEVRWAWDSTDYHIWHVREAPQLPNANTAGAQRQEEVYLLWGKYEQDGKFREMRISAELAHPVENAKEGDRAQIRVYEYSPAKPDFDATSIDEINRILNAPQICAHRFVAVEIAPPTENAEEGSKS